MKTAISIPDPIFQAAEHMAQRLKVSRSQLFTQALSEYVHTHQHRNMTERLNEIYPANDNKLDKKLSVMQARSLPKESW